MSESPLELYNYMYKNQICTRLSELYVNWAWELEAVGRTKKAEQVFREGIKSVEEDQKDMLEKKFHHFQVRSLLLKHLDEFYAQPEI
jgi:hypothetical protein